MPPWLITASPLAPGSGRVVIIRTAEGGRNAVTDTVIVRFEGDGSGVVELSWGQHEVWCVVRDKSDSLPIHDASMRYFERLAAHAVALSPLTSSQSVAVQLVVNNRFRPGLGGSVSTLAQSCPCLIEVGDARFEEVRVRARHSALMAYKHAYYDPVGKDEVSRRIAAERGTRAVPAMGAVR
jgi:hypothetical protein